jgi:hypothetical protein
MAFKQVTRAADPGDKEKPKEVSKKRDRGMSMDGHNMKKRK